MPVSKKFPKLTVVGAGPGDPDLITLKAIKSIESADVVLYDALVNKDLLKYARTDAELIFVGKRKGCYAYQQSQINDLIVARAHSHGHVVRLKGGDPFIFGRGAEELDHASQFGIWTEVVPGISSSSAVPAYQGIPLTRRGVAESFWVITGTTKDHSMSSDIEIAAQSTATVVILMGMAKLHQISEVFGQYGKSNTPVAVIQNGTTKEERSCFGTIENICKKVDQDGLSSPAIIIIGDVVKHRSHLSSIVANLETTNQISS